MPPVRSSRLSTTLSQVSDISETSKAAKRLSAVRVAESRQKQVPPGDNDGLQTVQRKKNVASFSSLSRESGVPSPATHSMSSLGNRAAPSTHVRQPSQLGPNRSPPSQAASSRNSVYDDDTPAYGRYAAPSALLDSYRPVYPQDHRINPYGGNQTANRSIVGAHNNNREFYILPRHRFQRGVIVRAPLHGM